MWISKTLLLLPFILVVYAAEEAPEAAIKFDNIDSEDYGDVTEAGANAIPDAVNDEIIEELVNKFLNTGSIAGPKSNKTVHANPHAFALINSSSYWDMTGIEEAGSVKDEKKLASWLDGYQDEAKKILREIAKASWTYVTNASPGAKASLDEAEDVLALFVKSTSMQAKQFDTSEIKDEALKKQLESVSFEGMSALSNADFTQFSKANKNINQLIHNAPICDADVDPPCALRKVDLESIFQNDKNATRLSALFVNYSKAIAGAKQNYQKLIDLTNKGGKVNGFADGGSMWISAIDQSGKSGKPKIDIKGLMKQINEKLQPFYQQLHAYIRRQLAGIYKDARDLSKDSMIPAHLLGSVDGDWAVHYEQTKPFDDKDLITEDLMTTFQSQNITAKQMFVKAYRYFKSVGFPTLPKTFWTNSVFVRVWSRDMICNPPAAIDMRDEKDFRVKVCAQIGDSDFKLAHSLMAQTYYQYLYREQPLLFREPASSSINEAIANVFSHLSVNPHYLYAQKLVPADHLEIRDSVVINRLYKEALENVAKIPLQLAADNWRYELFEGKVPTPKMNDRWWELRKEYDGVRAPQPYNSSNLDALVMPLIAEKHTPAIRDVITYIAQFQILKSVCPQGAILSEGCILSEDTTEKLMTAMKKGSSISWLNTLELITGKAELDVTPLLEYYEPLISWLQNQNEIDQAYIGWDGQGTPFTAEEIPSPRDSAGGSGRLLSEDRVAYPGGECTHGQECLLDSHCNGTTCVCDDKLFTLVIGDTVNCVPGNPADSGFGNDQGELVIGLFESETTTAAPTSTTTKRPARRNSSAVSNLFTAILLSFALSRLANLIM